jgi:homoaconitase/3-isopropylmalate dehydratase large subunit
VTAKDLILSIIERLSAGGGAGYGIEFTGSRASVHGGAHDAV